MKTITKTVAFLSGIALTLGTVLPAAALSVNTDVNLDASVNAGNDASIESTSAASASASSDQRVQVTRADLDANTVEVTSATGAAVETNADLSGFVAAHMQRDNNIEKVESTDNSVAVTYKQHAKLFGFLPLLVNVTTNVDENGSVKVRYPWYSVIMSTNKSDLEAQLQDRVNADLGSSGTVQRGTATHAVAKAHADAHVKLSAALRAKIIADIARAMHDAFVANVDAQTSANAQGSISH